MKEALEVQMEGQRESHHKQVTALRDEIQSKQDLIDQLREYADYIYKEKFFHWENIFCDKYFDNNLYIL